MNLYVSNLGFQVSDADLNELFSAYGTVSSAKVILDKVTGKSRGFAFVEMPSDEAGQKAISELDGKDLEGRRISVAVAKPREDRGGGNSFSRNRGSRW